jgi:NAD(P)-dependent dehydrogenase (short-subunit alcohol dehydrogenase family)
MEGFRLINPLNLTGKKILVTGASAGIGRATCIQLSRLGAQVILVARNEEKLNITLQQMINNTHFIFPFDLKNINGIEPFMKKILKESGPLDGLVHCAGVAPMRPLNMTTFNFINDVFLINVFAFIELSRVFSKKGHFNENASIIGISSAVSKVGDKTKTAYGASKGALDSAVKSMSIELSAKKIRVNTILPAFVDTEMLEGYIISAGADIKNKILADQYAGIIPAEDIGIAVAYLLSDASRYVTGTNFIIDAGATSH